MKGNVKEGNSRRTQESTKGGRLTVQKIILGIRGIVKKIRLFSCGICLRINCIIFTDVSAEFVVLFSSGESKVSRLPGELVSLYREIII